MIPLLAAVLGLLITTGLVLVRCMLHPAQGSPGHRRWLVALAVLLPSAMVSVLVSLPALAGYR